jgi:predicted nucleotidyltransferase
MMKRMDSGLAPLSPSVASALGLFCRAVRGRFGARVREMTLFGSHARGAAREESDVDVLVVIDDLSFEETRELFGIAYDVDGRGEWVGLAPVPLSTGTARDMRDRERLLMRNVARDGIAL